MKISWGYKIAGAYLLFVTGILFLVFKANQEKYDLVTNNYYEEELKYQNVIEQKQRTDNLSSPPQFSYTEGQLSIYFPPEFSGKVIQGEIYLYCPSNAQKDLRQSFTSSDNQYSLVLPDNVAGLYDIKLTWQAGGQTFFLEKKKFF